MRFGTNYSDTLNLLYLEDLSGVVRLLRTFALIVSAHPYCVRNSLLRDQSRPQSLPQSPLAFTVNGVEMVLTKRNAASENEIASRCHATSCIERARC